MRTSLLIDWLAYSLTRVDLSLPPLHPAGYVMSRISQWLHSVYVVACHSSPFAQLLILWLVRPGIILAH